MKRTDGGIRTRGYINCTTAGSSSSSRSCRSSGSSRSNGVGCNCISLVVLLLLLQLPPTTATTALMMLMLVIKMPSRMSLCLDRASIAGQRNFFPATVQPAVAVSLHQTSSCSKQSVVRPTVYRIFI